jgi:hypothetical protein
MVNCCLAFNSQSNKIYYYRIYESKYLVENKVFIQYLIQTVTDDIIFKTQCIKSMNDQKISFGFMNLIDSDIAIKYVLNQDKKKGFYQSPNIKKSRILLCYFFDTFKLNQGKDDIKRKKLFKTFSTLLVSVPTSQKRRMKSFSLRVLHVEFLSYPSFFFLAFLIIHVSLLLSLCLGC